MKDNLGLTVSAYDVAADTFIRKLEQPMKGKLRQLYLEGQLEIQRIDRKKQYLEAELKFSTDIYTNIKETKKPEDEGIARVLEIRIKELTEELLELTTKRKP